MFSDLKTTKAHLDHGRQDAIASHHSLLLGHTWPHEILPRFFVSFFRQIFLPPLSLFVGSSNIDATWQSKHNNRRSGSVKTIARRQRLESTKRQKRVCVCVCVLINCNLHASLACLTRLVIRMCRRRRALLRRFVDLHPPPPRPLSKKRGQLRFDDSHPLNGRPRLSVGGSRTAQHSRTPPLPKLQIQSISNCSFFFSLSNKKTNVKFCINLKSTLARPPKISHLELYGERERMISTGIFCRVVLLLCVEGRPKR